tara:strand:+ start:331 stop:558 length:228 start_codon:yes stop_codon:yes gene_type:complete
LFLLSVSWKKVRAKDNISPHDVTSDSDSDEPCGAKGAAATPPFFLPAANRNAARRAAKKLNGAGKFKWADLSLLS